MGWMMPFGLLAMLLLIMVPVPTAVLDILLLINIAVSILIFLMSIQAKNVLEFTILPTMLIFTTLARIVLNVSSSRLILGQANGGKVIDAIANITVNGDYVVGIIMFIIIVIVMFLVINKGTERVSEVSARFVLDGMPGKQMSIDADLNSGAITLKMAQKRRDDLQKELDFYKSMDGASKFIKGDAVAGLVITFINIVGGLIMGMTRHGLSLTEAASKYTMLSIGDGLVNQLPSLLIAASAAFMVTRTNGNGVAMDMVADFLQYKQPLRIVSIIFGVLGILSFMGLADGLPWVVCFILAALSYGATKLDIDSRANTTQEEETMDGSSQEIVEEAPENTLYVDKILMHVGTNVASAIVTENGGKVEIASELKYRIEVMRDKVKKEYGFVIPNVRITDDDYIPTNSFLVRIANIPSISMSIKPNCIFASFFGSDTVVDYGEEVYFKELGMKGYWVAKEDQFDVESLGALTYSVFDIIILYLEQMIENNLDKLITREDIKLFKQEVSTYNAAVVEEIDNKQIENGVIQKVTQNLLSEKISIKNYDYILECITDAYTESSGKTSVEAITRHVRECISNVLTEDKIQNGVLNVITLSNESNKSLLKKMKGDISEEVEIECKNIYVQIATLYKQYKDMGQKFVFLVDKTFRAEIFKTIANFDIKIDIVSYEELPKSTRIEIINTI